MKNILILFFAFVFIFQLFGQNNKHLNKYDQLPGMISSYKPAYSNDYPEWAKMLYQYPVNYLEVEESYNKWAQKNSVEKTAIIRYYKLWKRAVAECVLEDGSISIPDSDSYNKNLRNAQISPNTQYSKSNSDWSFLGPKETFWLNESGSSTPPSSCPWQVNVYSFDVAPSSSNILYAGTETHLVNKSIDNGFTWEQKGLNYVFGGGVTAVAIHPNDPETVYVSAGNQIHKTTDGGET